MSDEDSSGSSPLRRATSSEVPIEWDTVPGPIDFKFKLKLPNKPPGKLTKVLYPLQEGVALPFTRLIEGLLFISLKTLLNQFCFRFEDNVYKEVGATV